MKKTKYVLLAAMVSACSSHITNSGDASANLNGDGGTVIIVDNDGDICASKSAQAKLAPLDILLVLDTSYSMDYDLKWISVEEAMEQFVVDPSFGTLGLGLQYFPLRAQCNVDDYSTPAVGIAPLSTISSDLLTSLRSKRMSGGTPTVPMLEGTISYAKNWATQNPDHKVVIVIATDGTPDDSCIVQTDAGLTNSLDNAVQLVADSNNNDPKISTFVIGVGANLSALGQIAMAGGTGNALLVDTTQNVEQEFTDAIHTIRKTALACEYPIPATPDGSPLDYGKVNVLYSYDNQQDLFRYVGNVGNCSFASDHGWYYDDADMPTKVILCDQTCDRVQSSDNGEIDVQFGCPSLIL